MPENQIGTLEALGIEIAKVFEPFKERVEAGEILLLLAELGIELPETLANDTDFQNAVTGVTGQIGEMTQVVKDLITAINNEDYTASAEKAIKLIELIAGLAQNIETIATEIDTHGPYPGIPDDQLDDFVGNLAKNIVDYLIINYLQTAIPLFAVFLEFFGLIDETVENEGSANPLLPEYTKKSLRLDRIPGFLENPASLAAELYDWGEDDFTGEKLFRKLEKVLNTIGWPAVYDGTSGTPELDLLIAKLEPRTALSPKGIALTIEETIGGGFSQIFSQDKWSLEVGFDAGLDVNAGVSIQPNGVVELEPPPASGTTLSGTAFVKWTAKDNATAQPLLIFGSTNGSRLEAGEISALLGSDFQWIVGEDKASGSVTVEAEVKDGKVVIKPGDPDGFLAQILPPEGFTVDFNLLMGLNSSKGFYFQGSGTLDFDIPVSISLGPIGIVNLTVGISPGSEFTINLGADITLTLGPFAGVVEGIGMKTILTFPETRNGNLGPLDLGIDFKPPVGIGLSLDAGVVKGGGYLRLDYEKGEYFGALELDFQGLFGFTAIGLINTKFPDGSEGYSLLLLINVTFDTPIVLGYNFYLSGIGGIIGLHRTMNSTALQQRVKDGSLDNILFAENVIANITRIISDLQAIFPMKQDQFMLGIMARITWNTPALLTVEAGLVVEFPNPVKVAIIGVIKLALPTPDAAVVELNVAFVGIIDFEKGLLSFDASIFNSRILTITLEGDMALRISWGEQPDFLVSVGGFHPVYTPPVHLQLLAMKRITVNVLSGNPNLVLTAYFAITTNTIQFGAAINFSFSVSEFSVIGKLGFDVLIQFSPFRFVAAIYATVEVKLGSSTLFAIGLEFNLEGPAPWRAHGYAKFKVLFISFKVSFDKTWGEKKENSLPSISVMPLLEEEFLKDTNWNTKPAVQLPELVTLSNIAIADAILVRPTGSLEINQMVVPLDLTMSKFGNFTPADVSKVSILNITVDGDEFTGEDLSILKNSFAPSAFKDMSDQDKLQSPSYENQNSGIKLSDDDINFDYGINRVVEYESIISDFEEEELGILTFGADFFKPFVSGGDVGRSGLSRQLKNQTVKANKTVEVLNEPYVVVSNSDLSNVHSEGMVFSSKSDADEYLKQLVDTDPSKKGKVQLSPAFQTTI